MVTSYKSYTIGVAHFQGQEKQEGLNRVVAAIYEITHEKVVCVWALSSNRKEFFEIIKLAMNVSADCYWGLDGLDVAFLKQNLLGAVAERLDLGFLDILAALELGNPLVDIVLHALLARRIGRAHV